MPGLYGNMELLKHFNSNENKNASKHFNSNENKNASKHFRVLRVVKMLRFIGCTVRTHGTRKRKESGEASDPEVVAVLSLAKEKTASTKKEPKTPSKKEPETPSKKEPETPKKKRTKTPKPEKPPTPAKETNIDSSEQSVPKKKIKNEPTF